VAAGPLALLLPYLRVKLTAGPHSLTTHIASNAISLFKVWSHKSSCAVTDGSDRPDL